MYAYWMLKILRFSPVGKRIVTTVVWLSDRHFGCELHRQGRGIW
jgi:hypothetical protein